MRVQKLLRNTVLFPERAITSSQGREPFTGLGRGLSARESSPTSPWGTAVGPRIPILLRRVIAAETWKGGMEGGGLALLFLLRFSDFVQRCAASACRLCLLTYAWTFLRSLAMMRSVLGSVIVLAVGASYVDAFCLLAEVGASRSTGGSLLYVGMH